MTKRKSLAVLVALVVVALALTLWLYKRAKPVVEAPIPDLSSIKIDPNFCANNVAECERSCARCADKQACFKTGGECGGGPPPPAGTIQDRFDRGADVWWPGCHVDFPQPNCKGPVAIWSGDSCKSDVQIDEWFNTACHDAMGDRYIEDCDALCKKIGLGAGSCITDKSFCTATIDSAHCQCAKGNPGPSPPPPPTG